MGVSTQQHVVYYSPSGEPHAVYIYHIDSYIVLRGSFLLPPPGQMRRTGPVLRSRGVPPAPTHPSVNTTSDGSSILASPLVTLLLFSCHCLSTPDCSRRCTLIVDTARMKHCGEHQPSPSSKYAPVDLTHTFRLTSHINRHALPLPWPQQSTSQIALDLGLCHRNALPTETATARPSGAPPRPACRVAAERFAAMSSPAACPVRIAVSTTSNVSLKIPAAAGSPTPPALGQPSPELHLSLPHLANSMRLRHVPDMPPTTWCH